MWGSRPLLEPSFSKRSPIPMREPILQGKKLISGWGRGVSWDWQWAAACSQGTVKFSEQDEWGAGLGACPTRFEHPRQPLSNARGISPTIAPPEIYFILSDSMGTSRYLAPS